MDALIALLMGLVSSPWGAAAIGGLVMLVGPKLPAWLKPLAAALLARLKPAPAPAPVPAPDAPANPLPATGRPLLDLALRILAAVAAKKFPSLSAEAALERYLVEQTHYGFYALDAIDAKEEEEKSPF